MSVRAAAPSDKRALILHAARRLLVARGFSDIALDEVAREAGVAKGTLFLYYRSKDELVSAAFMDLVDRLGAELSRMAEAPPARGRALLVAAARAILEHFEQNRDFISHCGSARLPGCAERSGDRLLARFKSNLLALRRVILRCAQDGLFLRRAASDAAFLFGLCRSAFVEKALSGDKRPLAAQAGRIADFFIHGASR